MRSTAVSTSVSALVVLFRAHPLDVTPPREEACA
jgi:hypothetical protein